MKKNLLFFTTVMLGLTLFGCGEKNTSEATTQASQETVSEAVTTENDVNSDGTEYSIGDTVEIENETPFSFLANRGYNETVDVEVTNVEIKLTKINTLDDIANDIDITNKYQWTATIDGSLDKAYAGDTISFSFALTANYGYAATGVIEDDGTFHIEDTIWDIYQDKIYLKSILITPSF